MHFWLAFSIPSTYFAKHVYHFLTLDIGENDSPNIEKMKVSLIRYFRHSHYKHI